MVVPILLFAGLIVAPFTAFHKVRQERDKLKGDWSKMNVSPVHGDNWVYLKVKNIGNDGFFF